MNVIYVLIISIGCIIRNQLHVLIIFAGCVIRNQTIIEMRNSLMNKCKVSYDELISLHISDFRQWWSLGDFRHELGKPKCFQQ
jgi:ADP-glucose pyrophosphorylase